MAPSGPGRSLPPRTASVLPPIHPVPPREVLGGKPGKDQFRFPDQRFAILSVAVPFPVPLLQEALVLFLHTIYLRFIYSRLQFHSFPMQLHVHTLLLHLDFTFTHLLEYTFLFFFTVAFLLFLSLPILLLPAPIPIIVPGLPLE